MMVVYEKTGLVQIAANSSLPSWGDKLPGDELTAAIRHMVANISKTFIVEWYNNISPTNHDFVVSCESLIEKLLAKFADLCIKRLDKYKLGQLVTNLLHEHILHDQSSDKIRSIESQIQEHEYDICQNSVVRLFGLLCTPELRRVIFTELPANSHLGSSLMSRSSSHYGFSQASQQSNANTDSYPTAGSDCFHTVPDKDSGNTKTTSALYTLVIAMLTKATFMQIVDSISEPSWLYALIIWLCNKEEKDRSARQVAIRNNKSQASEEQVKTANDFTVKNRYKGPSNTLQACSLVVTQSSVGRSLDLEEGIDLTSVNINFENPICDSLKRPLDNIEIYATEEVKSTSSCYVLYCISYDGIYHRHPSAGFNFIPENSEVPIIDKRSTDIVNRRLVTTSQKPETRSGVAPIGRTFVRKMTIKRRFREFVILQLRLEENPKIRPYMKNIPKPTKLKAATQNIFSLPGITNIKLDQSTIKLRRRFLERFLRALNNSPFIANSYEFKEFFSYSVNTPSSNISKSKSLILQVNLNKVFVDSVRSAFSIIRSTLPGDGIHLGTSNSNQDAWLTELQQSTLKLHVQTRTSHSKMNLERYIDSKLLFLNDSPTRICKSSSLCSYYRGSLSTNHCTEISSGYGGSLQSKQLKNSYMTTNSTSLFPSRSSTSSDPRDIPSSSRSSSMESVYHDAADAFETTGEIDGSSVPKICDSVPIASKFIDILHYSMSKNAKCGDSALTLIARFMLGKTIERYAIDLLEKYITLDNAANCLNGITSSIWGESDDPPLDLEHASLDEAVVHLTRLLEHSYPSYPFMPKQLLNSFMSRQIRFFLSQLSSKRRNKFVIYSFFVNLLGELEVVEH